MSSTIFKRAEGKGLVFGDKKNRGSWLQIPILLYTLFTTVSGKETELKKLMIHELKVSR